MKKRFVALFVFLFACVMVFAAANVVSAEETSGTCGDNLTWNFDADTGTLTISGEGAMHDYQWIGSGNPVNPAPWAYLGYSVSKLIVEEGVTRIGNYAFFYAGLENGVSLPESVTQIGEYAFAHSHAVQIDIPSGVTHISPGAFTCCVWLEKVHIPDGVTVIGESAFSSCPSMLSIDIPNGVTEIGEYAFSHNNQFTSITIPETVTFIASGAFAYCDNLDAVYTTSVEAWCGITFESRNANPLSYAGKLYVNGALLTDLVIPEGTQKIGFAAFIGARCLTSVTIPKGVAQIGDYAFYGCPNIQKVVIPEGNASIGAYSFSNCASLQEVVIHEGTNTIGEEAFRGCNNLTTVWLPESLTCVGQYTFYAIEVWHVMYSGTQDQWRSITVEAGNDTLTRAILHTNCTGDETVDAVGKICSVCPSDLTYSCGEHITWSFDESTGTLTLTGEGEMYDGRQNWDDFRHEIKTIVVGEGITTLGKKAFIDSAVTSVSLPSSLAIIGESAFESCEKLTKIDIPEGVHTIGFRAFANCDFSEVKLPAGLTQIPDQLFIENERITKIVIPANVQLIGSDVFGSTELSLVEFMGDAPDISLSAFLNKALTVVYPAGNATWNDVINQKFEGEIYWLPSDYTCTEEAFGTDPFTWYYENGTLYISGDGYMGGWKATENAPWRPLIGLVEHVVITGKVSNVYSRVFSGFTNLKSVSMPDCITYIMDKVFSGCVSLHEIDLPESLEIIDEAAFWGCRNITTVSFPKGVTMIATRAFYWCNLKAAYFAGSVPRIDNNTFTSDELTIYYPAGNKTWTKSAIEALLGSGVHANTVFAADGAISDDETNHSGSCGENMTWKFSKGELTLSGNGDMYAYQIEAAIPWAHLCDEITSVVIGDGVTDISYYAFAECKNLKKVTFGGTLKRIGGQAFRGCSNLESVVLPASLEYIGDFSFMDCKKLETIVIPASVKQIDVNAFKNCKAMKTVYFEGSAPDMDYPFLNMTATVYYPVDNSSWNSGTMKQYGGSLTWKPYCVNAHSFGDWATVQDPTEEADGLEERICSRCGEAEQQPIPKLEPTQPPTASSEPATEPSEPNDPTTEPTQPAPTKPGEPSVPTIEPTEPSAPVTDVEPLPVGTDPLVIVGIVLAAVLLLGGIAVIAVKRRKR